jgi:hypothetical protein
VIGTMIGSIGVPVASELIIAVSAAAAAEVQSKVGFGFEILENNFGGSEMAGERAGIVSAMCRDCECNIGLSYHCCLHQ